MKDITEMTVIELYQTLSVHGKTVRRLKDVEDKKNLLTPLEIVEILRATVPIANIHGRLGVYQPDKGIYDLKKLYLNRLIYEIEPNTTRNKNLEVIFKLEIIVPAKSESKNKNLVPVANGIYNKQTKKLEPFNPNYIFTSTLATNYNPNALNPTILENGISWDVESWITELMADTEGSRIEEKELTLWQVISACVTGKSYRKAIFFVGDGNDGKGTIQQLITNVIGSENVSGLKVDNFSDKFSLVSVDGKRCIIGDDVQASYYLDDSSTFNSFITGEPVKLEAKGSQLYFKSFDITVFQSTNEMPKFSNKTNGTIRRLLILIFNGSFKSSKADNWKIKDHYIKRQDVREYVLKRALEMEFDQFHVPEESLDALNEFRITNDPVNSFFEDFDINKFNSTIIPKKVMYSCYKNWCSFSGYKPLSIILFGKSAKKILMKDWEVRLSKVTDKFHPHEFKEFYPMLVWGNEEKNNPHQCWFKL